MIQRRARKQIKMQRNQKFIIIVQIPNPVPEPYLTNIFKTNWHIKIYIRQRKKVIVFLLIVPILIIKAYHDVFIAIFGQALLK